MKKYITQSNFNPVSDSHPEKLEYTSTTVPSLALSIDDMFLRASHGILPDIINHSIDDDTPELHDYTDLDDVLPSVEGNFYERYRKTVTDAKKSEKQSDKSEKQSDKDEKQSDKDDKKSVTDSSKTEEKAE